MTSDDTTRPLDTRLGLGEQPDAPQDATSSTTTPATTTAEATVAEGPRYRSGPAPFALLLGILGLVTAGVVLLTELTDLSVPWDDLGPWTVVGGGAVVLLVGLVGLRGSRARD
ncbi:hypothetical protein [Phycicoccus avicenniae]|uniref:hypothetical protein n=1 Tax=Phycicoccus avicenniae TaxID=2828860 RepID=UPI003D299598